MNEQQLAAVKQALEALEGADQIDVDMDKAITALQSIISQDALHKMAEESRTNGLRLDDWDKIGCVNHDCDKCKAREKDNFCDKNCVWTDHHPDCKAVQEPVAWAVVGEGEWGEWVIGQQFETNNPPNHEYWENRGYLLVPIYTTPPAAQKPWLGLTDQEKYEAEEGCSYMDEFDSSLYADNIEAKLKEKNT
jgi:hypothetical protein